MKLVRRDVEGWAKASNGKRVAGVILGLALTAGPILLVLIVVFLVIRAAGAT